MLDFRTMAHFKYSTARSLLWQSNHFKPDLCTAKLKLNWYKHNYVGGVWLIELKAEAYKFEHVASPHLVGDINMLRLR